ncbi:hypothetical protein FH972_002867 [Carpinus fangiana]|uniref:Uncharacterized protein n=1 Tax=Carpinus fangiana TaxID=176857 RepID=A0A5N6QI35_9ROSI|nr:hypothetical protein FH972_002867 [Carpinus fangiana]
MTRNLKASGYGLMAVSDVSAVQSKQSEDIEDPVNEKDIDTTNYLAKVSSDTLLPKYNEQLQQSNS